MLHERTLSVLKLEVDLVVTGNSYITLGVSVKIHKIGGVLFSLPVLVEIVILSKLGDIVYVIVKLYVSFTYD